MSPKPRIVFLYSEIAGYFLACAEELAKQAEVMIVRWPVNSEAPFKFNHSSNIKVLEKKNIDFSSLYKQVEEFNPTKIICSGWMDKEYLKIAKKFHGKIPVVLTLDNHWTGSLKQRIATLLSPFLLKNKFSHVWVPGEPQTIYAKKLGFKQILNGFYCADVDLYQKNFNKDNIKPVKQFLYVGRYVKHKSIFEMWSAFLEVIKEESVEDWKMICIGTGEEWDNRIKNPYIEHIGFVQPQDLKKYLNTKSVYVLPSSFEPWGVSVQEFAVSGCPLIISKAVGAAELFLNDQENGLLVEPSKNGLKQAFKKMMALNESEFKSMSIKSNELGSAYTPKDWVQKIVSIKL